MSMGAIYVHDTKAEPYATQIVKGIKTIETRTRDVLGRFVGKRVLVIRTRSGHEAEVIGVVTIVSKTWLTADALVEHAEQTCIPAGSKYECKSGGKWCYFLRAPIEYCPIPLSELNVIHKTRSFAVVSFVRRNIDV